MIESDLKVDQLCCASGLQAPPARHSATSQQQQPASISQSAPAAQRTPGICEQYLESQRQQEVNAVPSGTGQLDACSDGGPVTSQHPDEDRSALRQPAASDLPPTASNNENVASLQDIHRMLGNIISDIDQPGQQKTSASRLEQASSQSIRSQQPASPRQASNQSLTKDEVRSPASNRSQQSASHRQVDQGSNRSLVKEVADVPFNPTQQVATTPKSVENVPLQNPTSAKTSELSLMSDSVIASSTWEEQVWPQSGNFNNDGADFIGLNMFPEDEDCDDFMFNRQT